MERDSGKKQEDRLEKEKLIKEKRELKKLRKLETCKRKVSDKSTTNKKPTINEKLAKTDTKKCNYQYKIRDYVVVEYDGNYYPGIINQTREGEYEISVMWPSGDDKFKWPTKADVLWYKQKQLKEVISTPQFLEDSLSYLIPEMKKYYK